MDQIQKKRGIISFFNFYGVTYCYISISHKKWQILIPRFTFMQFFLFKIDAA